MQGCNMATFRLGANHYCLCAVCFNLLVATLVLSASQVCRMADLCVLTGVFCDYADLLPQVLLAFPHAVARRHAQSHYYLSVGQR